MSITIENNQYTGFWKRLCALFIDFGIVILCVLLAEIIFLGIDYIRGVYIDTTKGQIGTIAKVAIFWLYYSLMESSPKQATVGKLIFGSKVCDMHGNRISFLRASARFFAKYLSALIIFIGFIIAAFTEKKQALHDIISKCTVSQFKTLKTPQLILSVVLSLTLFICSYGLYLYVEANKFIMKFGSQFVALVNLPETPSRKRSFNFETIPKSEDPIRLSSEEYEKHFQEYLLKIDNPLSIRVGPGLITPSGFSDLQVIENFPDINPIQDIKIRIPITPNFNKNADFRVVIRKVLDQNGKDIYNPDRDFDDLDSKGLGSYRISNNPFRDSDREIFLDRQTVKSDLKSIEGNLVVFLPINTEILEFNLLNYGQTKSVSNSKNKIVLDYVDPGQISLKYLGEGSCIRAVKAYNKKNTELKQFPGFRPGRGYISRLSSPINYKFDGKIEKVKVFVAQKMEKREYPFNLKLNQ